MRSLIGEQLQRRLELLHGSLVQDQDLVVVEDRVESVGDGDDRAVAELSPDRLLNQFVRLQIHGRRRFVHDEDLALPQDGPREAEQLLLTHRHVTPALREFEIEPWGKWLNG